MRTLSLGSPEWGATAMIGRFDSGPNTVVRCVRLRLEPMATPAGVFVVVTTLNPLDGIVRKWLECLTVVWTRGCWEDLADG